MLEESYQKEISLRNHVKEKKGRGITLKISISDELN